MKNRLIRVLLAMGLPLACGLSHGADGTDFLDPRQAFKLSISRDADAIRLVWTIAPGYHLYADRFSIDAEPKGSAIGPPQISAGERTFDKALGRETEVLHDQARITVPVSAASPPIALLISSQGCAAAGLCYPPQTTRYELPGVAKVAAGSNAVAGPAESALTDSTSIERLLRGGNRVSIAFAFLAFGLLLAFTPCVLPMVPILSSIIVGDQGVSKKRGFALAASYSMGMALVYTATGVAAGLAGEGLAAALQKPAVLLTFAALLIALALSMFDVYQLQLPASFQSRLSNASGRFRAGRMSGVFVMGAVSALIVGPCVAAPLAGALVYISQTRDVFIGGLALFCMACGMSVPLLLTGVSAGSLLPRAGPWMNAVKRFFGVLLIVVAIWMASPVLPAWLQMLTWGTLAIVCAMHLSAFDPLPRQTGGWPRLFKGIGVLLVVLGALQIIGLASGGRDPLQPLRHLAGAAARGESSRTVSSTDQAGARFVRIGSGDDLQRSIAASSRPVLLDVYADWCTACKEMELQTFRDPRVVSVLERFTLLQVDVTANNASDRAFMKRFGLFGPPGTLVLDRDGNEHPAGRTVGFAPADVFLARIDKVATAR